MHLLLNCLQAPFAHHQIELKRQEPNMKNQKQVIIALLESSNLTYSEIADTIGVDKSVVDDTAYFYFTDNEEDEVCHFHEDDHIYPEHDDPMADAMELGCEDYFSQWDDDPSPYGGTYSEMW